MKTIIDELTDILHQERALLLAGDISKLDRLHALKVSLFDKIDPTISAHSASLRNVSQIAKTNLNLLDAARSGIRSVRARLDPNSEERALTTYSQLGQKRSLATSIGMFERRS